MIKYCLHFFKKELSIFKLSFATALFLGILAGAIKSTAPYIINKLMTEVWVPDVYSLNYSIKLCALFALIWILSAVFRFFNMLIIANLSESTVINLKTKIFNSCLNLNPSLFVQKFPKGVSSILSQSLADLQIVSYGIKNISVFFREPFLLLFSIFYIIYLDWKLLVLFCVGLPLISFLNRKFIYLLKRQNHSSLEMQEDLTQDLKEGLEGLRTVHGFGLQSELKTNFKDRAMAFLKIQKRILKKELAISPLSEILLSFSLSIILIYVGHQIINKHLSIADFTSFLFASTLLQNSFKQLQGAFIQLQKVEVALHRLKNLFDKIDSEKKTNLQKTKNLKNWSKITIDNLSYSYPNSQTPALKNISFTIKKNTSLAIVGESGSGKSTLIKLLQGFLQPQSGNIYFGDQNIKEINHKQLLQSIALVEQNIFLFSKSIKQNILYGNINKKNNPDLLQDIIKSAKLANAHQFIMQKEKAYDSFLNAEGDALSGGQKQKINIARALFKKSSLLILDEATSALDANSAQAIQSTIDQLINQTTSLLITHRLHSIKNTQHIIVLSNGQIAEQGNHKSLMENKSLYFNLATKQNIFV